MPITYRTGNLLDDDAEALVNPVNCVRVAGKGLAKAFRTRFPADYLEYWDRRISPGGVAFHSALSYPNPSYIVLFATKAHWRDPSWIGWIESGLRQLRLQILDRNIRSIAIPKLGCGEGGLSWDDVRALIEAALGDLECDVRVYV